MHLLTIVFELDGVKYRRIIKVKLTPSSGQKTNYKNSTLSGRYVALF